MESITVQTKCYKGIVRPVLEDAASVQDPFQKHLQDKLEMVQRKGSAVPPVPLPCRVNKLGLGPLKLCRTSDKITTLYMSVGGNSHLHRKPCRGHEAKILVPYSKTKTHKNSFFPTAIRLWDIPPPPPPPPKKRLTVRLSPSPVFLYYP